MIHMKAHKNSINHRTDITNSRLGSIPTLHVKTFEQLNGTIKEKRSGKRNGETFATVLFLFHSVTPVPSKLDQTILFLSLPYLWLSRRYSVGN